MLTELEVKNLISSFLELKKKAKSNKPQDIKNLRNYETLCISKLKYLISIKTYRYKNFNNYEDIKQEGYEGLVQAINTYNPKKGSFFWWAHKYIDTRISRSANLHTTIRYPLKVAKAISPCKETLMPTIIESRFCPDKNVEDAQINKLIESAIDVLTDYEKNIVNLYFGLGSNNKPLRVSKICKLLNISRIKCVKLINNSILKIKTNISI